MTEHTMTEHTEKIARLRELLHGARYAVFFGGAGVSTASGIPDFRGADGLYKAADGGKYPPEYMLSSDCLRRRPQLFFSYYKSHMLYPGARPNAAHLALAQLEKAGLIKAVITQNIDGLHQQAGSKSVYELHGSVARNYCEKCGARYDRGFVESSADIPRCTNCGGTVRPDVVLYGEGLDSKTLYGAVEETEKADLLIVGGSSLTVNPAASLVAYYGGRHLAIINFTPTPCDSKAEILLPLSVAEVLPKLL